MKSRPPFSPAYTNRCLAIAGGSALIASADISMSPDEPILIVDDDEGICRLLAGALKKEGLPAEWRRSGAAALDWLRQHSVPLMLLDLRLDDMRGQDLIDTLVEEGRSVPFIVISGVGDVRVAVELMQEGALDFLTKDTQLLQLVVPVVRRCLDHMEQQRRLADIEGRFRQLADNIQSLFWISTPDMTRFIYISPAFERLWGLPVQSVYDHPDSWLEAVLPTDLPAVRNALERLKAAEPIEIEFRISRPDGETRWLHWTASPLRNASGAIERLTGFGQDITERKEINRRLLAAAEQERRRLGQDLHDDLCQRLAAIKLRCGLLERELARGNSPHTPVAAQLTAAIADATALSRSFARGLAPVALDSEGLVSALEVLTRSAGTIFGISMRFECSQTISVLDPDTATHIYRIAQELISNAAKHARPTRILVQLNQEPERLLLEVENDGAPFVASETTGDQMGLHFLRSRADAIGAALAFVPGTTPNGGTRAQCVLPISAPSATP
jgi:PAS domain S-box-containing protein